MSATVCGLLMLAAFGVGVGLSCLWTKIAGDRAIERAKLEHRRPTRRAPIFPPDRD